MKDQAPRLEFSGAKRYAADLVQVLQSSLSQGPPLHHEEQSPNCIAVRTHQKLVLSLLINCAPVVSIIDKQSPRFPMHDWRNGPITVEPASSRAFSIGGNMFSREITVSSYFWSLFTVSRCWFSPSNSLQRK